ncbi:zf-HC2 domain-containing protein [Microbulbifer sp. CAU 1566]|uniref:zf-HC2 domain-containing protein n=1 Tax=Microbulbifer sp. CAU 1566 TaxID=2933269 RepID=UPI002006A222|nr:zf-HC2 domain-containing protein [Microbulbifer sp. CAU 1566]MCK7596766.1 zf-HC2 domain-containing protein [Microbulbifer sp. CAU 1566]
MNCKQASRLLSEQLERPLHGGEKLQLKLHLLMCRGCRNFGDQMRTLRQLSKGYAKTASEADGKDGATRGSSDLDS